MQTSRVFISALVLITSLAVFLGGMPFHVPSDTNADNNLDLRDAIVQAKKALNPPGDISDKGSSLSDLLRVMRILTSTDVSRHASPSGFFLPVTPKLVSFIVSDFITFDILAKYGGECRYTFQVINMDTTPPFRPPAFTPAISVFS